MGELEENSMAFDIGTVCVKIAGRDAGKTCVVVDTLEGGFVLVDGDTRRRKVNVKHLEPTGTVEVKKGASHETVMTALGKEPRAEKKRAATTKPNPTRKSKPKTANVAKVAKKATKK